MRQLRSELSDALQGAERGLPDDTFSFVASVTPMVNVDLLIADPKGRILFAWRKDEKNNGWHIPGGIIRFKETFAERLHRTAIKELGTDITFDDKPLKISEIFMPYQRRGHFISFLYRCYLPNEYELRNKGKNVGDDGYLAWHDKIPQLVEGQKTYEEFLRIWREGKAAEE
ncbi:MAG: NUDIX hydrolase [Selenomonadaceae bacterium]|nr:NUDIX hydrolase [Selenomonadaceae bacterium]